MRFRILTFGRLVEVKNQSVLLKATGALVAPLGTFSMSFWATSIVKSASSLPMSAMKPASRSWAVAPFSRSAPLM